MRSFSHPAYRQPPPQQMVQHQPQPQPQVRTVQMMLVQTPQGMGWVPVQAMGQQAPAATPPNPVAATFKTLLIVGGLSFAGWWVWKKWGHTMSVDGAGEPAAGERHVRSRRRTRSRARIMSEFKHFLDDHGTGNLGAFEAEEAEECDYGFDNDDDEGSEE